MGTGILHSGHVLACDRRNLYVQSISYIDNRGFPTRGPFPPGPAGYQLLIESEAISVVQNVVFTLTNCSSRRLASTPALSWLCNILYEPLGHCLPLPHVPRLVRYVSDLSTS